MRFDISHAGFTLGVIGAGAMGRGIAQIAAQADIKVWLMDARAGAAAEAKQAVDASLGKLVEKNKITVEAKSAAMRNLHIADELKQLAPCHVVIEAIVENLEAKRDLFRQLETIVSADCLLATNTSSLQVTSIAAGCKLPGRVGGFHFFNPVPVMKLVEVIDGALTEPWVGDALMQLARRTGHIPVKAKDTPGFIVNHAGRGFGTEALRIVGEGVTDFATVDRILTDAAGFKIGPFALMDLTALDVSHPVMESIYNQYYQEPRFRPSIITAQRLSAGLLGRKTQRGFYEYKEGVQQITPEPAAPGIRPKKVWVSKAGAETHRAVSELVIKLGGVIDDAAKPAADSLCIVMPIGLDATSAAVAESLDAKNTVAIDTLFGLASRRTLMTSPITSNEMRDAAHGLFACDGIPVSIIKDSAGFVAQRVVAHIVNIGCDIAQQRIASPADIDRAVQLGLGYPLGPLAMGDKSSSHNILNILNNLYTFYGDPRYRASPWLKRRALLNVSLLTDEN
ncbi:MAG: 3-hydroxyacyl-CoA dehydrogenase [Burkholderiales bacterium]